MAYTKTPTDWVASWSEDGTAVTFPLASIPGLTADKADGATGDVAEILYALLAEVNAKMAVLVSGNTPPSKWGITRTNTPLEGGDTRVMFALSFDLQVITPAVMAVRDEP